MQIDLRVVALQGSGGIARFRDGNNGFGGEVVFSRPIQRGQLAFILGYTVQPGYQQVISVYSKGIPATGVNPSVFECRLRKPDVQGARLGASYRRPLWAGAPFYWHGGLRLEFMRVKQADAGTRLTTNGKAVVSTNYSDPNILAIETIASRSDTRSLSPELSGGLGWSSQAGHRLELTLANQRLKHPQGQSSGFGLECALGVRLW